MLSYSLAWPDLFLALGIIACSISTQPKKGLVICLYTTCSTATIVAAPIKSQYSHLLNIIAYCANLTFVTSFMSSRQTNYIPAARGAGCAGLVTLTWYLFHTIKMVLVSYVVKLITNNLNYCEYFRSTCLSNGKYLNMEILFISRVTIWSVLQNPVTILRCFYPCGSSIIYKLT